MKIFTSCKEALADAEARIAKEREIADGIAAAGDRRIAALEAEVELFREEWRRGNNGLVTEAMRRAEKAEAEVAKLEVSLMDLAASGAHRIASVEAALATAAARMAALEALMPFTPKTLIDVLSDLEDMTGISLNLGPDELDSLYDRQFERRAALTQPASTQPLTDQGETSTAGEVG